MPSSFSVLLRSLTYVCVVLALMFGAWKLIPLITDDGTRYATIYYSAPLALESTDISRNSVILALEERGYRAGPVEVSLVIMDDGDETGAWIEKKERANARTAVADETTIGYIGPLNSGAAKVSMPILNSAHIAQISPSNTWPGLTKSGFLPGEPGIFYPTGIPHYVRVAPTDDLQGPAGARWAHDLGHTDIYVVNDTDAYGIGIADLFVSEARRLGMNIIGYSSITDDPQSYKRIGDVIASSSATLVYYGGLTPNGGPELLAYIREKGSHAVFMGPDGIFEQDFIDRAGHAAAEGVLVTAIGIPPAEATTKTAERFLEAYRERYGAEPDVFGALAYDATNALMQAIERTGSTERAVVAQALRETRSLPGVFGVWGFDEHGDTTLKLMSGSRVENGTFVFEKVLSE